MTSTRAARSERHIVLHGPHRRHLGSAHLGGGPGVGYGDPDDGQDYIDRTAVDFDPAEGLYSGTAVRPTAHATDADGLPASTESVAQRAADRYEEAEWAAHDAFAVNRYRVQETGDIEAGAEIDRDALL